MSNFTKLFFYHYLGAVRHGGFIPWDDDIDIQMVRKEYNRFTKLWNKTKNEHDFELINIESGNNMGYPFGKIHNPKTISYVGSIRRTGVFVDLFPIDGVLDKDDFQKTHIKIMNLYKQRSAIFTKMQQKNSKFKFKRWARLLLTKTPKKTYNQVAEEINTLASKNFPSKCPYSFEMVSGTICKFPIPSRVFEDYKDIKFEDRTYMSVKDTNTYLTCTFGNYMQLPPVEERVTHHGIHYYWV